MKASLRLVWTLVTVVFSRRTIHVFSYSGFGAPETKTPARGPISLHQRVPWLIVGGGIHGVHIAACLRCEGGVKAQNLCIVDEEEHLLNKWKTRTASTGMKYLRSSAGYHLDVRDDSLRRFGSAELRKLRKSKMGKSKKRMKYQVGGSALFANDYDRPELDFFNAHCDEVIAKYDLDKVHERGKVVSIEPSANHVRVIVSSSVVDGDSMKVYLAENVVLALGNDEPSYPDWVTQEVFEYGIVRHLFDEQFDDDAARCRADEFRNNEYSVAVIGGGISAAHKALELTNQRDLSVHLICRHSLREEQFDTHQDWMLSQAAAKRSKLSGGEGVPKKQRRFAEVASWKERRQIIARERIPGTITAAVNRGEGGIKYAIDGGKLKFHRGEVVCASIEDNEGDDDNSKCCSLHLSSGEMISVNEIILATGFGKRRPGGKLIEHLIRHSKLEVSDFCGYPAVDRNLRWHPRVFVSGALAELELGPSARNIAGARLAAERIIAAARHPQVSQGSCGAGLECAALR